MVRRLWGWLLVLSLAACAATPVPQAAPQALLHDEPFARPAQPIDPPTFRAQ